MKTVVTFRSDKFPPYEDEEEQINPGMWGKRLAEYLVAELKKCGIDAGDIVAEDWGWYIPISDKSFPMAVCCGHQEGDTDEFLCFTDPGKPVIKKLFKSIDGTEKLTHLVDLLNTILTSDPDIRDVQWAEPDK